MVQIDILVDNNTLIDRYFRGEPGFSALIQYKGVRVLFDTGYSDLFLANALKMGQDLSDLDHLVLSHSHLDHTWGLDPLIRHLTELGIEGRPFKRPELIGHPEVFSSAGTEEIPEFGCLLPKEKIERHMAVRLSKSPVTLAPGLVFLGEIPRTNDFEGRLTFGTKPGAEEGDRVMEDSALAAVTAQGLVVITGCAHAGICNTIEYARQICREDRVADVIGGFHLQNTSPAVLAKTVDYFRALGPDRIHACHCTDLNAKIALAGAVQVRETGVGLQLTYED